MRASTWPRTAWTWCSGRVGITWRAPTTSGASSRWCAVCVRRTWRLRYSKPPGARAAHRRGPRSGWGAGGDRQPQAGQGLRQGHGQARQDRPDRRRGARPLRRGGEAGAAPLGGRARPRTLGHGAQEAPDTRHDDRRGQQGAHGPEGREEEDRGAPALAEERTGAGRARAGAGREGEPGVEGEGGPPHERPRGRSHALGHAAGGAARAGAPRPQAARCAGRGGAPQPGLRYPARDTHGVGRPLGGEDDPLHGYPVRRPPQPRDPRVLWTPGGLRQAEKGSDHGLHEETTDHPGRDLTELDPLAAAVATGLLGAAERARRSPRRSKRVGKTARSYLT